jgi:DNA-binding protein YbaB
MSETSRDLTDMLAQMQSVRDFVQHAQAEANDIEIAGRSSDGSVVIRSTLNGEFRAVEVDPTGLGLDSSGRPRRLEGNIMAALVDLAEQQKALARERAGEMAARFQLDIPGV